MSDFNLFNINLEIDKEDFKSTPEVNMDSSSVWDFTSTTNDFFNFDIDEDGNVPSFDLLDDTNHLFGSNLDLNSVVDGSVCSDSGVSSTLSPPHVMLDDEQNMFMVASNGQDSNDSIESKNVHIDIDMLDDTNTNSSSSTDTIMISGITPKQEHNVKDYININTQAFISNITKEQKISNNHHTNNRNKNNHHKSKKSLHVPAAKRKSDSNYQNSPSIYIPVNLPGVKTIKVVNTTGKPLTSETLESLGHKTGLGNIKFINATRSHKSISSPCQSVSTSCTEDEDDDESDIVYPDSSNMYPKLELTYEERKLMDKEGVKLPSHYPLTKLEERELKRIRRKIRNKISAQDSRKRKKEYVDGLEERVKKCTEDNIHLIKRIKLLETRNHTLCTQLRKIQTLLTNKTKLNAHLNSTNATVNTNNTATSGLGNAASNLINGNQVQSSTCLMVLCLSLALILAPNLQNGGSIGDVNVADSLGELNLPLEKNIQDSSSGRSRSLLFTKYALQHKSTPMTSEIKNAELVEEAYTKFLNSQGYGKNDTPEKKENGFSKQNKLGIGGLLSDLSDLLTFQQKPKEEIVEEDIIDIKDEYDCSETTIGGGKCYESNEFIFNNDHNYGKPNRKRPNPYFNSPAVEALPIKKEFKMESNKVLSFPLEVGGGIQEILDSPIDDFRPSYGRGKRALVDTDDIIELGKAFNKSKRNEYVQSSMMIELADENRIQMK